MKIYKIAAERYGRERQLRQLQEECAELVVAVNHYARGRIDTAELIDEIADVRIMLSQMNHYFGMTRINAAVTDKLEKLRRALRIKPSGAEGVRE